MTDKLRESTAPTDGATKSSLGDATKADLKKGYCDIDYDSPIDDIPVPGPMDSGGFLGRPEGWER